MRIDKECCPICGNENFDVDDYEEEPFLLDRDIVYKKWKCICQNGHKFSMSETYLLTERKCVSIEDNKKNEGDDVNA